MLSPAERAVTVFNQNFNCAQAVFSAFAAQLGLDEHVALKLASPFGGGVARRGEICGAVTGALLVLGLAHGADAPAGKETIYRLSQEFMRQFEEIHSAILCRELVDCDVSTPEGWQQAKAAGKFTNVCPILVRDAAELIQTMLEAGM
jgi:C_GCAxxG_C_C family probable redox protein